MQSDYAPESLDVASFSATASRLQGVSPLEQYPRLAQDCLPAPEGVQVRWLARGLRLALPGAGPPCTCKRRPSCRWPASCAWAACARP